MMIKYLTPEFILKWMWLWPPYLGAGVSVKSVNKEFTKVEVLLKQRFYNTNYVGSHFGGSLYSMCDPFYMFILLHHMKEEHIVWDQAASIYFLKPGKKAVSVTFEISLEQIEGFKKAAREEYSLRPVFKTSILDENKEVVAEVEKTLYIRRKDAKKKLSFNYLNFKSNF